MYSYAVVAVLKVTLFFLSPAAFRCNTLLELQLESKLGGNISVLRHLTSAKNSKESIEAELGTRRSYILLILLFLFYFHSYFMFCL